MERAWKQAILIGAGLFVSARYVVPGVLEDFSGPAQAEPQPLAALPDTAPSPLTAAPVQRWANQASPPEDNPPIDATYAREATAPADAGARRYAAPAGRRSAASDVYYPNCAAAKAADVAPIYAGEPGYRANLDGDGDGVACEPYRGR